MVAIRISARSAYEKQITVNGFVLRDRRVCEGARAGDEHE
jgi:hypothetical protein